ncbi:phasin family protein [Sphingomonas sp.]|uniref:phasin family protein n=1 Tax=Sphingomonas sp. TaxID=28214 RepID=UPI0035C7F3A2
MADVTAKPRAARTSKRAPVAVPFMPTAQADTDKSLTEVIEEIAHLPIDLTSVADAADAMPVEAAAAEPAMPEPVADTALQPQSDHTTAATTAPDSQEDDTMTDTMQNTAETMQANAQDAMSKGKQAFDDMTAFGQGNVEAMVESTRVAVKGMEAMAQARAAFAKQSFETTVQTLKSMSEVRSPADLFKLQGAYLRNSMDALVAETSRSTEATLKLVGEIAQPIQNRVALAAEKVRTAA